MYFFNNTTLGTIYFLPIIESSLKDYFIFFHVTFATKLNVLHGLATIISTSYILFVVLVKVWRYSYNMMQGVKKGGRKLKDQVIKTKLLLALNTFINLIRDSINYLQSENWLEHSLLHDGL